MSDTSNETVTAANVIPPSATQVRFGQDRRWWTIRARDDRFTILTRQWEFQAKGEVFYTIVDQTKGVRGPCNLVGQGWDFNADTLDEDAAGLLAALQLKVAQDEWLEAHRDDPTAFGPQDGAGREILWPAKLDPEDVYPVEISHRNNVPVWIEATR